MESEDIPEEEPSGEPSEEPEEEPVPVLDGASGCLSHPKKVSGPYLLESFDGKTGMEIADAALECHKSQQPVGFDRKWRMPYDCRAFGLYYTTVGPDVLKNDFLENIY